MRGEKLAGLARLGEVTANPADGIDLLPRRFGRYFLFDKIGEGGMARIYLARSRTELGGERLAVVKQILPMLSSSAEFSRLLIEEAKLAAQLTHGNIVQVFDLGREDNVLYIGMEYVEGFDLRELLRQCSKAKVPLPIEFSLFVAAETLQALDYAHRKRNARGEPLGVVHRDVSPSNILLSFEGEVKLCDFGIARAFGNNPELPLETVQGKAGYMSPEAARGDAIDGRSDVFAVGVILWELLAGRRLYKKGGPPTIEQAAEAHIEPLPPRGFPEEERLYGIVMRALTKNPDERFPSAEAMLRELSRYVADTGLVASPLRLGSWLMDNFGTEFVEQRRARERAAKAVEHGPLVELRVTRRPESDAGGAAVMGSEPLSSAQPEVLREPPAPRAADLPPPPSAEESGPPVVVPRIDPPPASLASSLHRRPPPLAPAATSGAPARPKSGPVPLWLPMLLLVVTAVLLYLFR